MTPLNEQMKRNIIIESEAKLETTRLCGMAKVFAVDFITTIICDPTITAYRDDTFTLSGS